MNPDQQSQGKDIPRERMGGQSTEAHLFRCVKRTLSATFRAIFGARTLLRHPWRTGKILQDPNTVESYSIEEKGFIVCMTSKVQSHPIIGPNPSLTPNEAQGHPSSIVHLKSTLNTRTRPRSDTCCTRCSSSRLKYYIKCPHHTISCSSWCRSRSC